MSRPNGRSTRARRRILIAGLLLVALIGASAVGLITERSATSVALADTPAVTLTTPGYTNPATPLSGQVELLATTTASIASVQFQYSPAEQNQWTTLPGGTTSTPPLDVAVIDTTHLVDGLYDLRAVVTDTSGDTLTSAVLTDRLIANSSPVVTLARPASIVSGTITLTAEPEANDPNNPNGAVVGSVAFQVSPAGQGAWKTFANVATVGDNNSTATFDTTSVPDGAYDFQIVPTDGDGDYFASIPVRGVVFVNTPPSVALVPPPTPLVGEATISATASSSLAAVASVRFQYAPAGTGAWIDFGTATASPYSRILNTLVLPNGDYDLRALATDTAGNQGISPVLTDIAVDNPVQPAAVTASITGVLAPASSIGLLGTITSSPLPGSGNEDGETWAYGLTSAPPAEVDGARLPYTAEGNQLVLLRYTDASGWQVADVLRNSDGSAFALLPPADVEPGGVSVTGAMAPSGEAWIAVTETPTSASGAAPLAAIFHRVPGQSGGQFRLDPELDPSSPSYKPALVALLNSNTGAAQLHIDEDASGALYGVLTAPNQPDKQVPVTPPSGGTPIAVSEGLQYALLQNGSWTVETASLPASYVPAAGDVAKLTNADVSGPGSGWGMIEVSHATSVSQALVLGRFGGSTWTFAPTGLDALDDTGAVAAVAGTAYHVTPEALRVFGSEVWVKAAVELQPTGSRGGGAGVTGTGEVVALIDATTGKVTRSWCAYNVPVANSCNEPLDGDHPADVPDAVFQTSSGEVGLALAQDYVDVYANDDWSRVAAPGYAPSSNASSQAVFSGPNKGWLAGSDALGDWSTQTSSGQLVPWPLPDRSPLTAIAVSAESASGASTALAVGLNGAALDFSAADGWLPAPLPTTWQFTPPPAQASHINLLGVSFDGPTGAFAVGQFGAILRWDGSAWSENPQSFSLTQEQLNAVAFAPSGEGWAVGANGTILHYDGQSWSIQRPPADDVGVDITSVTVAGSDVYAVAGGNLIELAGVGSTGASGSTGAAWQDVPASDLPDDPAPNPGDLRLVAGLPDGGLVAAGVDELLTRQKSGEPLEYSQQPIQGIVVALAPFRQGDDGDLGVFVSVAQPVLDAASNTARDVGGFPPGDGELMRLSDSGLQDLSQAQYAGTTAAGTGASGDGAVKSDPVLAVATDPTGQHAWAVGGYAGTVAASGLGTYTILPARSTDWDTASIWRYDAGDSSPPPELGQATLSLPATAHTVSFAFFSSSECRSECSAVTDAQPDVNLTAAATQIAAYAAEPGGPAFAVFGGNARGPSETPLQTPYDAAAEYGRLPSLLAPLGKLPLFGVLGPEDHVNLAWDSGLADPLQPWADAFGAQATPPFFDGTRSPAAAITPVSSGGRADDVNRYYAFDATQNGGTLRAIVLDNSLGSLEASDPGQTAWLEAQLAAAEAASTPVVVFVAQPLRVTSDGNAIAALLAGAGVLAVFTTNPSLLDQQYLVPTDPSPGAPQIPEYEGAALSYQQTANNGVTWYFVSVNTSTRQLALNAVPVVSSLALDPLQGLTVARSVTLQFKAIGRRPPGTLATYGEAKAGSDDGYPGIDQYVEIPAASCGSSPCISPSYSFTSSDPTIGNFVQATGPGSPYPAVDASGDPIPDPQSGLFCAYNSGTTTVSVTAGLLTYSLPVTVEPGDFGAPCGTVYRAGVNKIEIVIGPSAAGADSNPSTTPPPPPPTTPSSTPATSPGPIAVPIPHPAAVVTPPKPPPPTIVVPHPLAHAPVPAPVPVQVPVPAALPVLVPTPPTPVQPTPPTGSAVTAPGVAQSPATAKREEKAHKHASQSAFTLQPVGAATLRPAGSSSHDGFYLAAAGATVLSLLLLAATFRPGSGLRPAFVRNQRNARRPRPRR